MRTINDLFIIGLDFDDVNKNNYTSHKYFQHTSYFEDFCKKKVSLKLFWSIYHEIS